MKHVIKTQFSQKVLIIEVELKKILMDLALLNS